MVFLRSLQIAIPFVWFGAVGAISFMEAPLKFTVPAVTIPIGVSIGQVVFHMLNRIEVVLCLLFTLTIILVSHRSKATISIFAVVSVILILQTFWLFPLLDERSNAVISGTAEPFSRLHIVYIAADAIKVLALLALGFTITVKNLRPAI